MRNSLPLVLMIAALITPCNASAPQNLELKDGQILEDVTAFEIEGDRIRVAHSGGVGRIKVENFTNDSLKAMGMAKEDGAVPPPPDIKILETNEGKVYEGIRGLRVRPSYISFIHKEGAASVRFEQMAEQLRQQFGYNEEAAKLFDAERAAAEKAIEMEEIRLAKINRTARQKEEWQKRMNRSINEMEMIGMGDSYWRGNSRTRALHDALLMRTLQNAGHSQAECYYLLNRAKYR